MAFSPKIRETSSEEVIEKRYRHFMILLYPEDDYFKDVLQDIKGSFKNYAYIKHSPEEDEKKEHVHLILSLDNPRSISSLANRLGIPSRLIQNVKSLRGACRYLVHRDNEEKFQYNIDQVIVSNSFNSSYLKSFDDLITDDEILDNIFEFIREIKEQNPIQIEIDLSKFVCANAYDRVFKRYYNTIVKYINYVSQG